MEELTSLPFPTKIVQEGKARLVVPDIGEAQATTRLPAFYNPLSKVSRDFAVLITSAYFSSKKCDLAAEPLAGTGARIIRLLLESGVVSEGVAGDISEWAFKLAQVNAELNGLAGRLRVRHSDANLLLSELAVSGRADYVDIDPFGSPIRFLESGFRAVDKGGVIGVSATDLAALSGSSRRTAYWRYGLTLVKTNFFKETAIRALTGVAVSTASRLGLGAEPIFSVAYRHFVRVFFKVERGKSRAHQAKSRVKHLVHCGACLSTSVVQDLAEWTARCGLCGGPNTLLGPLWTGAQNDKLVVERVLSLSLSEDPLYADAIKVLKRIMSEADDIPWAYQLSEVSRRARTAPPKTKHVVERLRELGYRASTTHYDAGSVKTDAPSNILTQIVKELSQLSS